MLAWQRMHQQQGWNDLGYNAVICQHARAIEGRPIDQKGSHSPGVNWSHYGVQLMVANNTPPTAAMYARAAQLHADLTNRSGRFLRAWGHKDDPAASTACPGPHVETWVKTGGPYATPKETNMALNNDDKTWLRTELARSVWYGIGPDKGADCIPAPAANLKADPGNKNWNPASYLYYTYAGLQDARAEIAGLTAAVKALAASHGADGAAVVEAVRSEVAKAMQGLEITLTTPEP
jgi:hypothetical protein